MSTGCAGLPGGCILSVDDSRQARNACEQANAVNCLHGASRLHLITRQHHRVIKKLFMKNLPSVFFGLLFIWLVSPLIATSAVFADRVRLRSIGADGATGLARAVVVEEGALVHTALMFPEDGEGRLQGEGDAATQATRVLANLDLALKAARTSLTSLVRLHVYVADASVTPQIDLLLRRRFRGRTTPAVTVVETAMPRPGVLVTMDAIAATDWRTDPGRPLRLSTNELRSGPGGHRMLVSSRMGLS